MATPPAMRRPMTPMIVVSTTAAMTPPMNHSWDAVTCPAAMAGATARSTTKPMAAAVRLVMTP